MHTYIQLLSLYHKRGFHVRVGLNPDHFRGINPLVLPFAALFKDGKQHATGLGMSPLEISVMDTICKHHQPTNIFIIGNAFGWSTLALALSNPKANIVAIDALTEGDDARAGFDLTKKIAQEEGLNIHVIEGFSPQDVSSIVQEHFQGKVDFALIDGLHTNAQQLLDFNAVRQVAAKNCVYILHDVINHKMHRSFHTIKAKNPQLQAQILTRTTSGMGVVYPPNDPIMEQLISAFVEKKENVQYFLNVVNNLLKRK